MSVLFHSVLRWFPRRIIEMVNTRTASRGAGWLRLPRLAGVLMLVLVAVRPVAAQNTADNAPGKPARPAPVAGVAFSRDGMTVAIARGRDVLLVDPATGNITQTLRGSRHALNGVAFHPRGTHVAAAGGEPGAAGEVLVWPVSGGDPQRWNGHADALYALDYHPDGTRLVTASYDRMLQVWKTDTGEVLATLRHHTGPVYACQFSPDGQTILSGGADQTAKLWNSGTGERILTLGEATKGIQAVAWHPRGTEFAAAGGDRTLRLYDWDGTAARLRRSTFAHDATVLTVAYSPRGETLYSGSEDGRVKAWDVSTLRERHVYDKLPDWPVALAVDPRGERLACGRFDGVVTLWDATRPQLLRDLLTRASPFSVPAKAGGLPGWSRGLLPALLTQLTQPGNAAAEEKAPPAKPQPNPPAPRFDAIAPRSAVRGQTVKLTLTGQNIAGTTRVWITPSSLTPRLLPADPAQANQRGCEVDLPADFPPGLVTLRLQTPLGMTGSKSFHVSPFAEVGEQEPNNLPPQATPISFPATLTGTINARGDRDLWSFEGVEGQQLVFQLVGPHLGSALQGRLLLRDTADGRALATEVRRTGRSDVVLGVRLPRAGRYLLEVTDRDNTGGGNHFYLVQAGDFPLVTGVFPLAVRAGAATEPRAGEVWTFAWQGFHLGETDPVPIPSVPQVTNVAVGRGDRVALNRPRIETSAHVEFVERESNDSLTNAQELPIPAGVSGHIAPRDGEPTDVDSFRFTARREVPLTLEVFARRLGSPLDSVIEILDASGAALPRATLRSVAETYTELRDHDSRSRGIRLHNWEDLLPEDLVMLGGEVVKVQILPLGPDEDVKFFERGGLRLGYLGTTPEAHAVNSAAYKVDVHPPGTSFPPNGMPVVTLPWRNDDGGAAYQSDSVLFFDPPADGQYIVRLRDVRGRSGADFVYRLVIRERQEDFRVSIDPEHPNVPRGGVLPVNVTVERLDDFNGPIEVRLEGLPAGFAASTTTLGPNLMSGVIQLAALPGVETPSLESSLTWRAVATARVRGEQVERRSTPALGAHVLTVTSPPDLVVTVEPQLATIRPGDEVRFTATIERKNGFTGRVPVDVLNLPHGLRVLDIGLNGVLINETETSRSFVVTCDPWAVPGRWPFFAAARVESKSERHGSPLLFLEVPEPARVAGP
jgi:WD40 repeat protein